MRLATAEMKAEAARLGFQALGVSKPSPTNTLRVYEAWLGAGFHGEMAYLADHIPFKAEPASLLPGVKSVIAVSLNYNQPNPVTPGQPRIARYALGRDYHKVVRAKLRALQSWLEAHFEPAEYRICVDSAPLPERELANRAGLGWFGKNTCLIDSHRGSWFVLGFLLTSLEFEPGKPAMGGCGTCRMCIEACPTGAIVSLDGRWVVDSRRCISYLTIEKRGPFDSQEAAMVGDWTFGCDICQEVCPFNQPRDSQPLRAEITEVADFRLERKWPSLVELAQISEANWDDLTKGSPVRRAGLEGLRRNAKANLKNSS